MSDGGWSERSSRGQGGGGVALDSIVAADPERGFTTTATSRADERTHGSGGYPLDQLFAEVAFIAYHFNWAHDDILALPHWERRRWCDEISAINERMNERRE